VHGVLATVGLISSAGLVYAGKRFRRTVQSVVPAGERSAAFFSREERVALYIIR